MIDNRIINLNGKYYIINNILSVESRLLDLEIRFVDKSKMVIRYDNTQDYQDDLAKILSIISNKDSSYNWSGEFKVIVLQGKL